MDAQVVFAIFGLGFSLGCWMALAVVRDQID
jgi:hypothetical protein